jgi:LacI family transcriptional regulator
LICFNERMAMGAYQAAAELGLSVPEAVSLVAYEDVVDVVDDLRPPLTSIASPYRQIGREAVQQLLAGSWVGSAPEIRVAYTLRRRNSVAPLSGS